LNFKPDHDRDHLESASMYALNALSAPESRIFEAHLSECSECRKEVETLRSVVNVFASWPVDVLRPSAPLWDRVSRRISEESGLEPFSPSQTPVAPAWEKVADGFFCKVLSIDASTNRIAALVRLESGADYPGHRHAGLEELYMLHGELRIDGRTLHAGDFLRGEPGTVDRRVWTETGCTCLLFTSLEDSIL